MTSPRSCVAFLSMEGGGGAGVAIMNQGVGVGIGSEGRSTSFTGRTNSYLDRDIFGKEISLLSPVCYCRWTLFAPFRARNL